MTFIDGFSVSRRSKHFQFYKIRKLKYRKAKLSVYSHTVGKWQSQGLNLALALRLLVTTNM